MGFTGWTILLASEIDHTSTYKDILKTVEASHDYIKRELTDMCWFSREKNVNLKVGWILQGNKKSDEQSFDQEFKRQFDDRLGFIYVVPGRTFNPNRLRSAPYFCANPLERILLQPGESVTIKLASAQNQFGQQATKAYENFLRQIVRLYDKTVGRTERGPLTDRLQQIIDYCTK
ncbi:hypothetical protein HYT52_01280 [Candidatus Woesearchaeota archaeon]|nr:hypothetical protein [Candidatus Woesearchaeota archaeon]